VLAALGRGQHHSHRRPDDDESSEDPQQQSGLVDRHPRRQLLARQKESRAADLLAVVGNLGDLTGDGGGRVVRGPSVGIDEHDSPVSGGVGHRNTVTQPRMRERRRVRRSALGAIIGAAAIGAVTGALVGPPSDASGQAGRSDFVVRPGDVVRVSGIPVGCRVVTRGVPPATMLDCRRAGPLRGTYGILFGRSNVRVIRFTSTQAARIVVKARHGGDIVCCSKGGR
jgi:hypothetical protein